MSIFHAYDVRAVYGEEFDEGIAYLIGRAVAHSLAAKRILVGMDMRPTSPGLKEALIRGLRDQGADVVDIGLCSTPMFYWATQQYAAGVMVTASHNPAKYNGFKICKNGATPVGGASGLKEIEQLVLSQEFPAAEKGKYAQQDVLADFLAFNRSFLKTDRKFTVVIDTANGMGGYTYGALDGMLDTIDIVPMFFELDGSFPNHEANPLNLATLDQLKAKVKEIRADLGVAIDGDGDRLVFVDERGDDIPADLTTALIAKQVLHEQPGATILYDIRSSRVCPEEIAAAGGVPMMTRVGHAFIKLDMQEHHAAFGGEISGHYYNQEQQNAENTMIVFFRLLNLIAEEGKPLSEIVLPLRRYAKISETNFTVKDKQRIIDDLSTEYGRLPDAQVSRLDGVRVDFPDWWFNVRASNTEPLLRLNLEAKGEALLAEKLAEITARITR